MSLELIVYPVIWSFCVPFVVEAALVILPGIVLWLLFLYYGRSIDEFIKLFSLGFTKESLYIPILPLLLLSFLPSFIATPIGLVMIPATVVTIPLWVPILAVIDFIVMIIFLLANR